jgi:hypothetical protein
MFFTFTYTLISVKVSDEVCNLESLEITQLFLITSHIQNFFALGKHYIEKVLSYLKQEH